MTLTKTEQKILARTRWDGKTYLEGKREIDAAKKLVAKGLAERFVSMSGLSQGHYYVSPFTGKGGITKSVFVYGGEVYFKK